jgi:hypothetical protein
VTTEHAQPPPASLPEGNRLLRRILSLRNFVVFSIIHSVAFTGLMVCAFVLGSPQPITFAFGFTHGVMYMIAVAAAVVATRLRIISLTTAIVVVVVGLAGPYFGAFEFVREYRKANNRE